MLKVKQPKGSQRCCWAAPYAFFAGAKKLQPFYGVVVCDKLS